MKSKSSPEWQSQTLMKLAVGALSILGEFNEEKKKIEKDTWDNNEAGDYTLSEPIKAFSYMHACGYSDTNCRYIFIKLLGI